MTNTYAANATTIVTEQESDYNDCVAKIAQFENDYANAQTTLERYAAWKNIRAQRTRLLDITR